MSEFRWLQISDLHMGMREQERLWPSFKGEFFRDLRVLLTKVGPPDLVLFSGDFVQRGSKEEYDAVTAALLEIWNVFSEFKCRPALVTTPGNHDLVRPSSSDQSTLLLNRWFEVPEVRDGFFQAPETPYRKFIEGLFDQYEAWKDRLGAVVPILAGERGLLPGDSSYQLNTEIGQIGIVTLNSTWLQIGAGDYRGRLHVDPRQLYAVTRSSPDAWVKENSFNLLVTHQPSDWLHPESLQEWRSEVNPPGRFSLHTYGHMHMAATSVVAVSGGAPQRSLQAPSLFGLERIEEAGLERIHGYVLASVTASRPSAELKVWPRKLRDFAGNGRRLGPDPDFILDEDNSFTLSLSNSENARSIATERRASPPPVLDGSQTYDFLRKLEFHLPRATAHETVRNVEQNTLRSALQNSRAAWIASEWGMGVEGFQASIINSEALHLRPSYRLDLANLSKAADIRSVVEAATGVSLEAFVNALADRNAGCLVLDGIPDCRDEDAKEIVAELESTIAVILDYCQSLRVLLCSRRLPRYQHLPSIVLRAFEEPDVRAYCKASGKGGAKIDSPEAVGRLFRYTDGVPLRIDNALRDLEILSLSELTGSSRRDKKAALPQLAGSGAALAKSVEELAGNPDPILRRAYQLLKVLTVLPQGDRLHRIRRFLGSQGFHPENALALMDRGLLESSAWAGSSIRADIDASPVLTVPRPVRDYVATRSDAGELRQLRNRAIEMYFGTQWSSGTIKLSPLYRFDKPQTPEADVRNAATALIELARDVKAGAARPSADAILSLATGFTAALIRGDHFHRVVDFCRDLFPLLEISEVPDEESEELRSRSIRVLYGRALRMIGEHARSINVLERIGAAGTSKIEKSSIAINLALAYRSVGSNEAAISKAHEAIRVDRKSHLALQAQGIIIDLDVSDPNRSAKLSALELTSRRRGAVVVAHNLAMDRIAQGAASPSSKMIEYQKLAKAADAAQDRYNGTRAIIRLAKSANRMGEKLSDSEKIRLMEAYQFSFSERVPALIEDCHDALWEILAEDRDFENLLSLFRHSSLYWRLRGLDKRENQYLEKLAKTISRTIVDSIMLANPAAVYYVARATSALSVSKAPDQEYESQS